MSALDDLLKAFRDLRGQPLNDVLYEIEKLKAIKKWAIKQLGLDYAPGDRVQIVDPPSIRRDSGWWRYREALAAGQTGIAGEVWFSTDSGRWYVDLSMDRTWSVSEEDGYAGQPVKVTRYWNGPASETPEGYRPPSKFDQERHPGGKIKIFMMRADRLSKVPDFDLSGLPRNWGTR